MLAWITIGVFFSCSEFGECCLIQLLTGNTLEGLQHLDSEFHNMLRLASHTSRLSLPGALVSCTALLAPQNGKVITTI